MFIVVLLGYLTTYALNQKFIQNFRTGPNTSVFTNLQNTSVLVVQ